MTDTSENDDTQTEEAIGADNGSFDYLTEIAVSTKPDFSHGTRLAKDKIVLTIHTTPWSHDVKDEEPTEETFGLTTEDARELARRLIACAEQAEKPTTSA